MFHDVCRGTNIRHYFHVAAHDDRKESTMSAVRKKKTSFLTYKFKLCFIAFVRCKGKLTTYTYNTCTLQMSYRKSVRF